MPRPLIAWCGISYWNERDEMSRIEEIASALEHAEMSCTPLAPLSETHPMLTPTEAYAIQSAWFATKLALGARLVGHKIGLTSQAMQQQMGVNQPDYGFLLDTMAVLPGGVLALVPIVKVTVAGLPAVG